MPRLKNTSGVRASAPARLNPCNRMFAVTVARTGKPSDIADPVNAFNPLMVKLPLAVVRFTKVTLARFGEVCMVKSAATLCKRGADTSVTSGTGPTVNEPITVTTDWRSEASCAVVTMLETMFTFCTMLLLAMFAIILSMPCGDEDCAPRPWVGVVSTRHHGNMHEHSVFCSGVSW